VEDKELIKLERVARNLINSRLQLTVVEGDLGNIYLATGLNAERTLVGLWGHRGVARDIEFKDGTSIEDIRAALVTDATGMIELFHERGLLDGGEFNA